MPYIPVILNYGICIIYLIVHDGIFCCTAIRSLDNNNKCKYVVYVGNVFIMKAVIPFCHTTQASDISNVEDSKPKLLVSLPFLTKKGHQLNAPIINGYLSF